MVNMRASTILMASVLASSILVAAAPATTPQPNRRGLIGRNTYKEIAKLSSHTATDCGFDKTDYGKCFEITGGILTAFIDFIWDLVKVFFGGHKPDTSADALCICISEKNELYTPSSYKIPSIKYFNHGLASKYKENKKCDLPKHCTPNPHSKKCCDYTCDHGSCGGVCMEEGKHCHSGVPVTPHKHRRRGTGSSCPAAMTDCPTSAASKSSVTYECVNTMSDLYSCGGCVYPSAGNSSAVLGQDCTAIPHVSEVYCQQGSCVIETCELGYELAAGEGCVFSDRMALRLQKYRL